MRSSRSIYGMASLKAMLSKTSIFFNIGRYVLPILSSALLNSLSQANRHVYPVMYRVALDVLPMQASAVPSERVFSSSKETMTARRANLSPQMMEVLQILKYAFRHDRMDFLHSFVATEADLRETAFTAETVADLAKQGKFNDIAELFEGDDDDE